MHEQEIAHIKGWDFSHIRERYREEDDLPWDFESIIKSYLRENIKLAYRSIKGNKGSHTAGVDGRTIKHLSKLNEEEYISLIQKQFLQHRLNYL